MSIPFFLCKAHFLCIQILHEKSPVNFFHCVLDSGEYQSKVFDLIHKVWSPSLGNVRRSHLLHHPVFLQLLKCLDSNSLETQDLSSCHVAFIQRLLGQAAML